MFYLRLNKAKVLNNREAIGRAEIQFMSFVTTGDTTMPELDEFFNTVDPVKRQQLITSAIKTVVASRILTPVYKISSNHQFNFGDSGYVIFRSESIPVDINWQLVVIELDKRTRDNAALVKAILTESNLSTIVNGIASLSGVVNPVPAAVMKLTSFVVETIADLFKNDKDDQIGLLYLSLNRREHYLHGQRDKQDVPDLTGNMFVDYSIFAYEDGV